MSYLINSFRFLPLCPLNLIDTTGLVAYYPLNGNTLDYSDNNFNGVATNTDIVVDREGKFDGGAFFPTSNTNRLIDITSSLNSLVFPISVAFWVKASTIGVFNFLCMIRGEKSTSIKGINISINTTEKITMDLNNGGTAGDGTTRRTYTSTNSFDFLDKWVHIVITITNFNTVGLYVNGVSEALPYNSGTAGSISYGNDSMIGARQRSTINYGQNLTIDEFSIWNRILTASEAQTLAGGSCPLKAKPLFTPYLYVGSSTPFSIFKFNNDSTEITNQEWPQTRGTTTGIGQVVVDKEENVIAVGSRLSNINTVKYDSLGNILLSVDSGADFLYSCVVDSNNNFIVSGDRVSSITTRKYSPTGTLIWSVDGNDPIWGMDIDSNDNIIIASFGGTASNRRVRKYDPDGTLLFSFTPPNSSRRVFVCDDNTFIVAYINSVRKYTSAGSEIWSISITATNYIGVEDKDGNIIIGSSRASSITTRKYNSARTLLWSRDHGDDVWYIKTDRFGNIYTTGQRSSGITTRAYDPDGTLLWSIDGGGTNGRSLELYEKPLGEKGTLIASSLDGTNRLMKSTNGINWTTITTGDNGGQWAGLVWAKDKGIIVATDNNRGTTSKIMYSTNGTTWTTTTIDASNVRFTGIAYSPSLGKFSAIATDGTNRNYYSTDGINFTGGSISSRTWLNIIWAETFGLFLAAGRTGGNPTPSIVASSSDGETYTDRYTSSANHNIPAIGYSPTLGTNGRAVILPTSANTGRYSDDGTTWTSTVSHAGGSWQSIAWSPKLNIFVAVGQLTNFAMSSTDGITWTTRTAAENNQWQRVIWSDYLERFIAVSLNGTNRVMHSTNGINWFSASASEANQWYALIYTDGLVF